MGYFQERDVPASAVSKLWSFEMARASGSLNPVLTLAGSIDASAPSPGFPLAIKRIYRQPMLSRYSLGSLGRGWSHNWETRVEVILENTNNRVVVRSPFGADRWFMPVDGHSVYAGPYVSITPDGSELTYIKRSFQLVGSFQLVMADKTVWQFNSGNLLYYVQDPNGNRITCAYAGTNLISLTHSSGQRFILDYSANGRLWHVTDQANRVTTCEYDSSGEHLTRVTAPGERVTSYAYLSDGSAQQRHALITVTRPDLTQDSFLYDTQGRLTQTSSGGDAQKVTYSCDSVGLVTVTDGHRKAYISALGTGGPTR